MIIKRLTAATVLLGILIVLATTTSPANLPAAVFIGVFIAIYGVCFLVFSAVGLGAKKVGLLGWHRQKIQRLAGFSAGLLVFLLGLQSIGQLSLRDILLTIGLTALLYFYFNRVSAQKDA